MAHKRNLTWDEWVKLKAYHDTPWALNGRDSERQDQRREITTRCLREQPELPFPKPMAQAVLFPGP